LPPRRGKFRAWNIRTGVAGMNLWKSAVAFAALLIATPAWAEPRVALVIGNSAYDASLGELANPVRDAELIAASLKASGFDVELVPNADRRKMFQALARLGQRIRAAGEGTTALFYYAGHGLQSRMVNYLVPVGALIESEADIKIDSIPADSALDYMEEGGAANSIVILDACRNTPIVRRVRSLGRGYAPIEKRGSSLIAVSTSTGEFALDGDGENSPYAAALAREMRVPGQGILDMFINVRNAVIKETRGAQEPTELSSSLSRNFPFTVKVEVTISAKPEAAAPALAPGVLARDFATVPTGTSPDAIVMAGPYLRDGPVLLQIRDVSPPGAEVAFYNNRALYEGKAVAPTISQNMLTMRNTGNVAAAFTLTLPAPAAKVSFMIPRMFPETESGITFPSWKATALSASGAELDTRSRALARKLGKDMEREVVTLSAPAFEGISAIRFESDPRLNGTPFAAFSAILIEGVWVEAAN
jgi:hypothetical protein